MLDRLDDLVCLLMGVAYVVLLVSVSVLSVLTVVLAFKTIGGQL